MTKKTLRELLVQLGVATTAFAPQGEAVASTDSAPETAEISDDILTAEMRKALGHHSPLNRVEALCDFAVAENPRVRLIVARALELLPHSSPVLLAIEHLVADPSAEVRKAAARASWAQLPHAPYAYFRLLERLAHDPSVEVREVARVPLLR
jgi:hypothetical protein